jgi:prepilin-type processing-associated H-X9-DG protein
MGGATGGETSSVGSIYVPSGGYPKCKRMSDIRKPNPTDALTFIDESLNTIDDGLFFVDLNTPQTWGNAPTVRHARGATLAFADGHAEHWKWLGLSVEQGPSVPATLGPNFNDLLRLERAIYTP